jgi:hypothetical protein
MRQGTNSTGPLSESTCHQSANEFWGSGVHLAPDRARCDTAASEFKNDLDHRRFSIGIRRSGFRGHEPSDDPRQATYLNPRPAERSVPSIPLPPWRRLWMLNSCRAGGTVSEGRHVDLFAIPLVRIQVPRCPGGPPRGLAAEDRGRWARGSGPVALPRRGAVSRPPGWARERISLLTRPAHPAFDSWR